jgi:P4 family phage/plasmid primase-like protien
VRQTVENVTQALEGYCLIEGTKEMPCWVGESPCVAEGDLLAMENGLLDVEAAVSEEENPLHEHTPYWFSVTYLPYEYDPEARCRKWIKFLKEVLPGSRERRLLQEFIGYCLTYDTSYHKALILVGEGANGKSVITEVATQLLGRGNVSHVGLERFDDRFAMGPTIGRLANIVSEIPTVKGVAEDMLKAVISGDLIRVEFKYHDPIDARPTARLIFATNELPEFWDKTEGLWRRLLVIPFSVTIPEKDQDRKLAANICERELPGLLNWALRGLTRLRDKEHFTVPESSRNILEQHRLASNPARQYLKTQCEFSPDHKTLCEALYHAYASRCCVENTRPLNRQQFGREVHRAFPEVQRKQLRTRATGTRLYYYVGLRQKPKTG